jgi:predicted MPP superfamily phosphohydrolase
MWPFGILTKIVYKWMDYGLTQIGDFSLYTSSGVGTWWPPMRVWSKSEIVIITLHKKS